MKKLAVAAVAAVVLVSGGLAVNSFLTEPQPSDTNASSTTTTATSLAEDDMSAGKTEDAGVTEDASVSSCGCEGGQFAANVSSGANCEVNGFCQTPVDCQSWESYAKDQLGEGPWPDGSAINPDESCGPACAWVLSCQAP